VHSTIISVTTQSVEKQGRAHWDVLSMEVDINPTRDSKWLDKDL